MGIPERKDCHPKDRHWIAQELEAFARGTTLGAADSLELLKRVAEDIYQLITGVAKDLATIVGLRR